MVLKKNLNYLVLSGQGVVVPLAKSKLPHFGIRVWYWSDAPPLIAKKKILAWGREFYVEGGGGGKNLIFTPVYIFEFFV